MDIIRTIPIPWFIDLHFDGTGVPVASACAQMGTPITGEIDEIAPRCGTHMIGWFHPRSHTPPVKPIVFDPLVSPGSPYPRNAKRVRRSPVAYRCQGSPPGVETCFMNDSRSMRWT